MTTRIFIADHNTLLRETLALLLDKDPDYQVSGCSGDSRDLPETLRTGLDEVDLVLLEVSMPRLNGIEAAEIIRTYYPCLKLVFLTDLEYSEVEKDMQENGIHGYISKFCTPEEVLDCIKRVMDGEEVREVKLNYQGMISSRESSGDIVKSLTAQEIVIIRLISLGNTTKDTARKLTISEKTVETHRKTIRSKTGLKNSALITRFAIQQGIS